MSSSVERTGVSTVSMGAPSPGRTAMPLPCLLVAAAAGWALRSC